MKETPILFSTLMVQAILEGRKTQTRRIVKPQSTEDVALLINLEAGVDQERQKAALIHTCRYQPGRKLWVRETWQPMPANAPYKDKFFYKADDPDSAYLSPKGWEPSIHMPREACRLLLEIVSVRIERLCDITEEDAKAEGVKEIVIYDDAYPEDINHAAIFYNDYLSLNAYGFTKFGETDTPAVKSFNSLWQLINQEHPCIANPWVWVIEFKRIPVPSFEKVIIHKVNV